MDFINEKKESIGLNISTIESEDGASVRGDLGPQFGGFFGDGAGDGTALSFTLVVDDHSGVVFTVNEGSVGSSPGSSLSNDDGRVNFLSSFVVTLLD